MTNKSLNPIISKFELPVGLGCSRLGSVLGASVQDSEKLLRAALDQGIRFYDTSNIYAQGESEQLLGRTMSTRQDVVICTKVGKYLPLNKRILLPFKSIIKQLVGKNEAVRAGVRSSRARGMPTNWNPEYIQKSVEKSLRRLNRDHIHVLMLHSPSAETVRQGDAIGALAKLKSSGKIGAVGVSVDDVNTAMAALADPRVEALQIPLHPSDLSYDLILKTAYEKGIVVIAREVLGGPNVIGREMLKGDMVTQRLKQVTQVPGVSLALLGTTKVKHLEEAIASFR
ncbi:MAG: hypothetical protein RLZZ352_2425 [Pseudomonadota bacterium]|jgi:aryl-alcohol dehydrogenase-like predicted oxidoreductase